VKFIFIIIVVIVIIIVFQQKGERRRRVWVIGDPVVFARKSQVHTVVLLPARWKTYLILSAV